jgi:hypothetical protein
MSPLTFRSHEKELGEPNGSPLLGLYMKRRIRWLYGVITLRTKEANAVPKDVMPKWCVSDGGLFYSAASLLTKPSFVVNIMLPDQNEVGIADHLRSGRTWSGRGGDGRNLG